MKRLIGLVVVIGCGAGLAAFAVIDDPPQFTAWSAAANLGAVVNSTGYDACPTISKDGLSLYFRSNRPGSYNLPGTNTPSLDIYVSQRDSLKDPWETPVNLGSTINSPYHEYCTAFSPDGHWMVFVSFRPVSAGGCGGQDLWISHRKDKRDDFGWETPQNLGCGVVNSTAAENGPAFWENEATSQLFLYFSSGRGAAGDLDIYVTEVLDGKKEQFGPVTPVFELNTSSADYQPVLRKDGLELFFASDRPGSIPVVCPPYCPPYYPPGTLSADIWVARRDDVDGPWTSIEHLGPDVNSAYWDFHPTLSRDGATLIFASERAGSAQGGADLFVTTRAKLRDER